MNSLRNVLIVILAIFALYVMADAAYRLHRHRMLESQYRRSTRYGFSATEAPLYVLDEQTGYSYSSNAKLQLGIYDEENNLLRQNKVILNNLGHLSLEDYSIEKPNSEFRIAVLGDSFTASIPSDITWPTVLQRLLNADDHLKQETGKSTFKVLNFGLDGTGIVQWPKVYDYKAKSFDPDLVIVSFIENDIHREFIYRKTITLPGGDQVMMTCPTLPVSFENRNCLNARAFVLDPSAADYKEKASRIKKEIYEEMVQHLPWYSPYPELLATALRGRWGLQCKLQLKSGGLPFFENTEEALTASLSALRAIAAQQPGLMILFHPTIEECLARQLPATVTELQKRASDLKIENMLEFLPINSSEDEIKKWYNVPYDGHPSNYGAEVYARAVAGRIQEYLSHVKGPAVR